MTKNISGKTAVPANPGKILINKKSGGKKGSGGAKATTAPNGCRGKKNFALHNKTHKDSKPRPKGKGPNGFPLQSHHPIQREWANVNIDEYKEELAPTITIESQYAGSPHYILNERQKERRRKRVSKGKGPWSSTINEEIKFMVEDLRAACFKKNEIREILDQQYKMLDKLKVKYKKVNI